MNYWLYPDTWYWISIESLYIGRLVKIGTNEKKSLVVNVNKKIKYFSNYQITNEIVNNKHANIVTISKTNNIVYIFYHSNVVLFQMLYKILMFVFIFNLGLLGFMKNV